MKRRIFLRLLASAVAGGVVITCFKGRSPARRRIVHLAARAEGELYRKTIVSMGTFVTISMSEKDAHECLPAINQALAEFRTVETLMSTFDPGSEIASVNRCAGERSVRVDARICEVVDAAKQMAARSDGLFDLTVLPLLKAYGFRDESPRVPDPGELAEARSRVDYRRVFVDRRACEVGIESRHTSIDLGGIAKGYAVDRAVDILRSNGVRNAVIDAGGDILAMGAPAETDGWEIGIQHPLHVDRLAARIRLRDQAIATSGNYERHVSVGMARYGHILDPRTGYPSETMLSASVIAPTALEADALSTMAFLLGRNRSIGLITEPEGARGVFITAGPGGAIDIESTGGFPLDGPSNTT